MTREEAIEWMQEEKARFERAPDLNGCPMTECWQKAIDVYDMAISALREQDVADKYVGKMTNADRIRAMSDKELARLRYRGAPHCKSDDPMKCNRHDFADGMSPCELCYYEWLQQPAGEEDKHENYT